MAKRYQYVVDFNGGAKRGKSFTYGYGHTKAIRLVIGSGRASITFSMGVLKSVEDLITFRLQAFKDAYWKVLLLHSLFAGKGLLVRRLAISIDGDRVEFDKGSDHFPFMFSMLEDADLDLTTSWISSAVVDAVLSWRKSSIENDYCCCAVNAYLLSCSRRYRIDSFLNRWTAMNSIYNDLAHRFELFDKARPEYSGLSNNKKNDRALLNRDYKALGSLVACVEQGTHMKDNRKIDGIDDLNRRACWELAALSSDEFEIFDTLGNSEVQDRFPGLTKAAESLGVSVRAYLTFALPYWLRCKYFHGSKPVSLFQAYNDIDVVCLGVVNHYLDKFLLERIPLMFESRGMISDKDFAAIESFLTEK